MLQKLLAWSLALKKNTFYLIDFETDLIIKSTPGGYYRRKNGKDFKVFWHSDIVFRAVNGQNKTTKKAYEDS